MNKNWVSEQRSENQSPATPRFSRLWALTFPGAGILIGLGWALVTYLRVREIQRMKIKMTRLWIDRVFAAGNSEQIIELMHLCFEQWEEEDRLLLRKQLEKHKQEKT